MTDRNARTEPPLAGDELSTLVGFLDYFRITLRRQASGLDSSQLSTTLGPSTMTLGGIIKHLAVVESSWFSEFLAGGELIAPFDTVDWDADRDWEWHTAKDDDPEELLALFDRAVDESRRLTDEALGRDGLDTLTARTSSTGKPFSLRWILVHMIEEYARHAGHADLIRESIDGAVDL